MIDTVSLMQAKEKEKEREQEKQKSSRRRQKGRIIDVMDAQRMANQLLTRYIEKRQETKKNRA
jgi:hypothetical protein